MLNIGYFTRHRINIVLSKANINKNRRQIFTEKNITKFIMLSINIALYSISLEFIEVLLKNPGVFSISNMGRNYIGLREELAGVNSYSIPLLLRFATAFFRNSVIILGPYYFRHLKRIFKIKLIAYLLLLFLVNAVAYGTQKFIGDILIYWLIYGIIKMMDFNRLKRIRIIKNSVLTIVVFFALFSLMQLQRYDTIGVSASNFEAFSTGHSYYDTDHLVFKIFGNRLGFGIATLMSAYMAGGYYGLSLCLKLPFVWTYGFGSSYIISAVLNRFIGITNLYEMTYLNRMMLTYGRDGLRTWNTIFPWLASDLTFIGALLIFLPVGYFFSVTWYEIINYNNPVSIMLFSVIFLGLIFVPANNQLFHGIDTFISTTTTIIYWLANHKKYNQKIS
jgi:hypothetical protein